MQNPNANAELADVDVLKIGMWLLGFAVDHKQSALVHHIAWVLKCKGLKVPIVIGWNAELVGQGVHKALLVLGKVGFGNVVEH